MRRAFPLSGRRPEHRSVSAKRERISSLLFRFNFISILFLLGAIMGRRIAEPSPIPRRFLGGPSRKKGEPVPRLSWVSHCDLGKDTVKVVTLSWLSTATVPPCSSVTRLTMARPTPLPAEAWDSSAW